MQWKYLALAAVIGCGSSPTAVAPPTRVEVNGPQLWVQVAGEGDPTVVFEAGGGDDSSVWAKIEPQIRTLSSVRTVVYDRAGLGKSAPAPGPYRIDDEAAALKRALDRFGVRAPVVLVAHSYGGFIATLVAATDARIAGVVFVDANLAEFFDDAELARLKAKYEPQFEQLRRTRPALADAMIPLMRAYPETVHRLRGVAFPPAIPVIDIVAEVSWGDTEAENAAMRRAHDAFVAGSPEREMVVATGSGHYVMRDREDLVVSEVARMVRIVRHH
jgi:pimeloyl-ACP methyl ester carboxylesterase